MKNLLLSLLSFLFISFSIAQDKKDVSKDLKLKSVKAVDYLHKNIKLDEKQKSIFMNEFAEYAFNMAKAISKSNEKGVDAKGSKGVHQYMLRFSAKRDKLAKACLKKKQVKLYDEYVRHIHPFTLEVRKPKKRN
ncbi:MAG: hypothetical protein CMP49_03435 [Flavobacteriales bacterium]|nr:hypothetical protein [Flavobacteriales bacterium]|tara:strand:+ start:269 stop:670 length:402 start_codon:yes stop_codon:yes gene_type:complete